MPPLDGAQAASTEGVLQLGDWRVFPQLGLLERQGERRRLPPQQMDLLVFLASNRERVVSKEEIFDAVWQDTQVEEVGLPRCISEIRKTLGDDARQPRYIQTVPKKGYRLVADVRIIGQAPDGRTLNEPRVLSIVGLSGLVIALGIAAYVAHSLLVRDHGEMVGEIRPAPAEPLRERPVVAVLSFANLTRDPEASWLSTALSEMLSTELAASRELQVLPGHAVADILRDYSLADREAAAAAPEGILATVGTDYVVRGSFRMTLEEPVAGLALGLRVVNVGTGETVTVVNEEGAVGEMFDLVFLAALRVLETLGVSEIEEHERRAVIASLQDNPAAAKLYFEALRRLRRFEASAARELLDRSISGNPEQPFAHLVHSEALAELGYVEKARVAARRAFELASELPREQRLWLEANHRAMSASWDEAIDLYRALWVFYPENLEYGLKLARTQNSAGRAKEALSTLSSLRELYEPGHRDPRLELVESQAEQLAGNHEASLTAAVRAAEIGSELGAELVVARARLIQASALYSLGRIPGAMAALREARTAFVAVGDRRSEAQVETTRAAWQEDQGEFDAARERLEWALGVFQEIGDRAGEASVLLRLAGFVSSDGHAVRGEAMFREAIAVRRETDDRSGEAEALTALAIAYAQNRRYDEAEENFARSLGIYGEIGNRDLAAATLINLGKLMLLRARPREAAVKLREARDVLEELGLRDRLATADFNLGYAAMQSGDLAAAQGAFTGAEAAFRQLENRRMTAASLAALGGIQLLQENFDGARKALERALALRREMGDPWRIADSLAALAEFHRATGDLDAAERAASEAVTLLPDHPHAGTAIRQLAEVRLARGHVTDARRALLSVREGLNRETSDRSLLTDITAAKIRAREGDATGARNLLLEVLHTAEDRAVWGISIEARVALGEIEIASGRIEDGRERLKNAERESRQKGWILIANRARAALERSPQDAVGHQG